MEQSTPLTLGEAASIIAERQTYTERLNSRTAGLSALVWALLLPAIMIAWVRTDLDLYAISPWLDAAVPIVLAAGGLVVTRLLARERAVKLGNPLSSRSFWVAFSGGVLLLAVTLAAFALVPFLKNAGAPALFPALAGAYLVARGYWLTRQPWGKTVWPTLLGLLLLLCSIVLAASPLNGAPDATPGIVMGAMLVGTTWFVHGLILYLRG